ncbi:hypothetical protein SK128_012278 [Halocaridina rubra]|uniref:WAP domain-containing protein n=1 Tax=Halocaridina rubra TaxID=373956 RepID=A0AAN8WYL5_HALRR
MNTIKVSFIVATVLASTWGQPPATTTTTSTTTPSTTTTTPSTTSISSSGSTINDASLEPEECPLLRFVIDNRNGNCKVSNECPPNHKCCYWMCLDKSLKAPPTTTVKPHSHSDKTSTTSTTKSTVEEQTEVTEVDSTITEP